MENLNKKPGESLSKEEAKNKELITSMWVLMMTNLVFGVGIILLASFTLQEGLLLGAVVGASILIMLLAGFYALKLEVDAGYYECANCLNRFVPSYKKALGAMHMSTTRYLKCPKCGKRTWAKKVMSKQ